jgi:F-type H+-transporting ATPase subunit delta
VDLFSSAVGALSASQKNFLTLLAENDRLQALSEIHKQFEALCHAANAELTVEIQSAFALSDQQQSQIVSLLQSKYGRAVTASTCVVPQLIGGVKLVMGDEVIDASVSGKLAKMSTALMN